MPSMADRLNSLDDDDRRTLQYAFEQGFGHHIDLGNGNFIGVNVEHIQNLETQEIAGTWAYGKINDNTRKE